MKESRDIGRYCNGKTVLPSQWLAWQTHAKELGFHDLAVVNLDLSDAAEGLNAWLSQGMNGDMQFMQTHAHLRTHPTDLVPGARTALMFSMPYLPNAKDAVNSVTTQLTQADEAYISIYARGRDYHKVLRQRLQSFANFMQSSLGKIGYRVFCDSAPVMEVELATRAGLGWRGKHTLLLNREAGSLKFLGVIYTDIPIQNFPDLRPVQNDGEHCGSCTRCIEVCPTGAITAPYRLDARLCISYLTIELKTSVPEHLRPLIGNRVLGCDDCQSACPWNKFAQSTPLSDFSERELWKKLDLLDALAWTEQEFLRFTEGTAIRRIGHARWQRNVAIALGNSASGDKMNIERGAKVTTALQARLEVNLYQSSEDEAMVHEHVHWALNQWRSGD